MTLQLCVGAGLVGELVCVCLAAGGLDLNAVDVWLEDEAEALGKANLNARGEE